MKWLNPAEKRTLLQKDGDILYLYNETEELAVRIEKQGKDWLATVKYPYGVEVRANYDKSRICGEAFAFGDVLTKEEYESFPKGFELDKLSVDSIRSYRRGEYKDLIIRKKENF